MIELELVDRYGQHTTVFIPDVRTPILSDALGQPLIDYGELFPQPRINPYDGPLYKTMMNAFLMRPSTGLNVQWLQFPDTSVWERYFEGLTIAIYIMTGKKLIAVTA